MINATYSSEMITYSLIIDDIRLSDAGTYSCQSDNQILKLFRLNIVGKIFFCDVNEELIFVLLRTTVFHHA